MNVFKSVVFIACLFGFLKIYSQDIPSNQIIEINKLASFLKPEVQQSLGGVSISEATLAAYFRDKFSERYFYNWKDFEARFKIYNSIYPEAKSEHTERGLDHLSKFPDASKWKLPFNYKDGEPVNVYAMRHLARQHKMVDIAFYYHYQNKNATYLNYFKNQLKSLNTALLAENYETIEDGNGVYEAFRAGYRILNWLEIHNMFLGEKEYSDEDQLLTIATLLQHASSQYKTNTEFVAGNHQTRGMSALAMLSILFTDFKDADKWYERSMNLLEQHLDKEINSDGFQFERTVHYHMSDIDNYYFVYQLTKNSQLQVNSEWESKLKSLFVTLTKIAYPDKSTPVFSDDTNSPWAGKNDISGTLTLGYLLFEDKQMGYFANKKVEPFMYWYINDSQLNMLETIQTKIPDFNSVAFPETGFYIMREGWKTNDKVMAISNGLDTEKPDHQHGDMLGIQAMANGQIILPNYQVRYSLNDYQFFKNSMVKNVALVDDELQGKDYASNQGGSGFGKFITLPQPKTIAWNSNELLDVFIGSHNGFENVGVGYSRQVIYLKNDFWIVKDNFTSDKPHTYKQIWQGHYSLENAPNLLRSTFNDGSGSDIYQLVGIDSVSTSGTRGKQWAVASKNDTSNFNFITVIFPFAKFDARIDEDKMNPDFKDWKLNNTLWKVEGIEATSLAKGNLYLFFGVKSLELNGIKISFSEKSDVFLKLEKNKITLQSLSPKALQVVATGVNENKITTLSSGNQLYFTLKQ